MKALVAYYSESDNTKKLADAVATGLGTQALSLDAVHVESLATYDVICIGTPVHGGAPNRKVKDFIASMPPLKGKGCAAFCTMHAFGDQRTLLAMKRLLEARRPTDGRPKDCFLRARPALHSKRRVPLIPPALFGAAPSTTPPSAPGSRSTALRSWRGQSRLQSRCR